MFKLLKPCIVKPPLNNLKFHLDWWNTPRILALRGLKHDLHQFEANLVYIVRHVSEKFLKMNIV